MTRDASALAHRLAREAEAVCRHYLSNGRREGRYWLVGDVRNTPGRSLFVRLNGPESGKGAAGKYEYAIRMYSETNTEVPVRPNRISGYVFNLAGGLGSGAYFQNTVVVGQWIMVTLVVNDKASSGWPDGYIALYKDGSLEDQVSMKQYDVTPHAGNAPFCIGTRDNNSYFEGAIGKVAVYDRILTSSQIAATYSAMFSS